MGFNSGFKGLNIVKDNFLTRKEKNLTEILWLNVYCLLLV